ncbi:MAG: 50S ribosomal protein L18 [Candidatus Omnitrophota bacterium]|nr:MAG: 50S ribosomal protein L18 [Candidatus Omnitrophota bacterium]
MDTPRIRRHKRIRKKIFGTKQRPRLAVYKSLKNIYAQIIDDQNGNTIFSCSTLTKELKGQQCGNNLKSARLLGEYILSKAKEKNVVSVLFDRSGYRYHGKVKALAEVVRNGGLMS